MSTVDGIPVRDRIELRMSAQAENLALARLALGGVGASVGAPEEVIGDLKLAVTEACTNAIQHAYAHDHDGAEIVVRYDVIDGKLCVEVEDFGAGFDAPPGTDDRSARRGAPDVDGGMGLMIIKAVTDELHVTSTSFGTRLMFAKRFDVERDDAERDDTEQDR